MVGERLCASEQRPVAPLSLHPPQSPAQLDKDLNDPEVASCFTPQLLISGLDTLNLKCVESKLVRARSGSLMPAQWINQAPSLLPGLLLTEPSPDHSDKDILVLGLKEKEE